MITVGWARAQRREGQLPLSEDAPRQPLSPYGVTKLAGVIYLDAYRALHGLSGTTCEPLRGLPNR